jgi:putative hemolysin
MSSVSAEAGLRVQRSAASAPRDVARPRLSVSVAETREDVRDAQRLRHRVFIDELGAHLGAHRSDVERDRYDPFCEHLIVRDRETLEVIGTYRLLTPQRAERLGTFISAEEFDLSALDALRGSLAEVGRACIHPAYRSGAAIMLLWTGIARYVMSKNIGYLFGCASIGMEDGGANARSVYEAVAAQHLAPAEYRVTPRRLGVPTAPAHEPAHIPPLLKGYLRLGAWICGEPAWDPEFNTADLLVLLPLERVEARYARHFLRSPGDS